VKLGIDASNIRAGGGLTHLVELLRAADPSAHGFSRVIVWGGTSTLARIDDRPWLVKAHRATLDKSLVHRTFWQRFRLSKEARATSCDVLFVAGGSYAGNFHPVVAFHQNLLPFEWPELRRYGWSWMTLKLAILNLTQSRTFRRAEGVVFLTRYARDVVMRAIGATAGATTIVPHGVDPRFIEPPREQFGVECYSLNRPIRLLYVSHIDVYKHQWHVAEAIARLRVVGLPVTLDLVGSAYPPALKRLRATLAKIDPDGTVVRYSGKIPYAELHSLYAEADLSVFASSCESFGQILTEAMLAGLPIACSNRSAMPELLGDAGVYFEPEEPVDIARAIGELVSSPALRARVSNASFERSKAYSWQRCARETLDFLASIASGDGRWTSRHNP